METHLHPALKASANRIPISIKPNKNAPAALARKKILTLCGEV
jgi:hypothetical protein